jgi:putative transcriptional regulator
MIHRGYGKCGSWPGPDSMNVDKSLHHMPHPYHIDILWCTSYIYHNEETTIQLQRMGTPVRKPSEPIIYNRIAALRAERGLSRQELAQALDISYQDLGYLELGAYNPDLDLAFRIAEYFALPIESIFSRTPFKPTDEERHGRSV